MYSEPAKPDKNLKHKGRSPLPKGRRPLTRFLKRKALVPWCPGFGTGENLPKTNSINAGGW